MFNDRCNKDGVNGNNGKKGVNGNRGRTAGGINRYADGVGAGGTTAGGKIIHVRNNFTTATRKRQKTVKKIKYKTERQRRLALKRSGTTLQEYREPEGTEIEEDTLGDEEPESNLCPEMETINGTLLYRYSKFIIHNLRMLAANNYCDFCFYLDFKFDKMSIKFSAKCNIRRRISTRNFIRHAW